MPELVKGHYARRNAAGKVLESVEQDIYKGDLIDAVQRFPKEWSSKPWKVDPKAKEDKPPKADNAGGGAPDPNAGGPQGSDVGDGESDKE